MKSNFSIMWQKYGTFGILIIVMVIFGISQPGLFFSFDNITQIILQSSVNILIACGEFFAILIAGIDLSVGSVVALTGMFTGKLLVAGMNPIFAILIGGVLAGAMIGLLNGFLVNVTELHPFIITLGTQAIFRGITLIISDARPVFGFNPIFTKIVAGRLLGIPVPAIIAIFIALALGFLTSRTKVGRNIYALGGNRQAAWFSGIDVKLDTLIVFIISGTCAGIAGVVSTARVGAAEPGAGTGFETFAIAAAIIGGTSFFGGKGKIFGVVMGGLIIGVINNGLNLLTVPTYYQQIVMGGLIILAVTADKIFGGKQKGE